jgi:hypothetical protein
MREVQISVLGGCHIVGYPYEVAQAFPSLLAAQIHGQVVARTANLQFVKLPQHLPAIEALHPSLVLLQLGNYEFCASVSTLLRQVRSSLGLKSTGENRTERTASITSATRPASFTGGPPPALSLSFRAKLLTKSKRYGQIVLLGLLISVLWLCSPQHRQAFRALNACVQAHPNTAFLFLSPFPHLDPAVDALRRLGSWLLRRGLQPAANFYWVNSHLLIPRDPSLFYDLGHLNEEGHRNLAAKLTEILPNFKLRKLGLRVPACA